MNLFERIGLFEKLIALFSDFCPYRKMPSKWEDKEEIGYYTRHSVTQNNQVWDIVAKILLWLDCVAHIHCHSVE